MSQPVHLAPESVEAVALRVVELLREGNQPRAGTLTAAQVAERLGTTRDYVYRHQAKLGGSRLSDGPKARLRFSAQRVDAFLQGKPADEPHRPRRSHPRRRSSRGAGLLPVKGEGR